MSTDAPAQNQSTRARGCGVYIFGEDDRVLLTQRGPGARHQHYRWEAPGGAVEEGETFEQAAHREILEELGIEVELQERLAHFEEIIDSNGDSWEGVIFKATTNGVPAVQEPDKCVGFGWFTRDEIARLSLADYIEKDLKHIGWL